MFPKLPRAKILTTIALISLVGFAFLHLKHLNTVTSINNFLINSTRIDSSELRKIITIPKQNQSQVLHQEFREPLTHHDQEVQRSSVISSDLDDQEFGETCHTLMGGKASQSLIKESINQSAHRFVYDWINNSTLGSCDRYLNSKTIPFIKEPVDKSEEEFPLAFAILVYHNFLQLEQLFRVLYRPQNFYCIHVDASAEETFKQIVSNLWQTTKKSTS